MTMPTVNQTPAQTPAAMPLLTSDMHAKSTTQQTKSPDSPAGLVDVAKDVNQGIGLGSSAIRTDGMSTSTTGIGGKGYKPGTSALPGTKGPSGNPPPNDLGGKFVAREQAIQQKAARFQGYIQGYLHQSTGEAPSEG